MAAGHVGGGPHLVDLPPTYSAVITRARQFVHCYPTSDHSGLEFSALCTATHLWTPLKKQELNSGMWRWSGGPYAMTISAGSLTAANGYALSFDSSGLLTVTPRPITGSVVVNDRVYDGTTAATGTVTLNDVLAGDDIGTTGTVFTFTDRNAGTNRTVTISGTTLTGTDAGNYTLTMPATALADIIARLLVITADDQEKTQGNPDPALTFVIGGEGLVAGDTLSGALAREPGEFVGDYIIGQGTLDAEAAPKMTGQFLTLM